MKNRSFFSSPIIQGTIRKSISLCNLHFHKPNPKLEEPQIKQQIQDTFPTFKLQLIRTHFDNDCTLTFTLVIFQWMSKLNEHEYKTSCTNFKLNITGGGPIQANSAILKIQNIPKNWNLRLWNPQVWYARLTEGQVYMIFLQVQISKLIHQTGNLKTMSSEIFESEWLN